MSDECPQHVRNELEASVAEFRSLVMNADVEDVGKETEEERQARIERRAPIPRFADSNIVAVDMDSTLAATWDVAFDLLEGPNHAKSYDDLAHWDWGVDEYGYPRFLNALWGAWTIRSDDIEPMESGLANVITRLNDEYEVHIVTAHPDRLGLDEAKEAWLDAQGIPYDKYVSHSPDFSKGGFQKYRAFIDDKPAFVENVPRNSVLYLRTQRYNRDIDTDRYENVERVRTVAEAVNRIIKE